MNIVIYCRFRFCLGFEDSPPVNNIERNDKSHPRIKDPLKVDRPGRYSPAKSVRTTNVKSALPAEDVHRETRFSGTQTDNSWTSRSTVETQTSYTNTQITPNMLSRSVATQTTSHDDHNLESIVKACKAATSMLLARLSG